MSPRAAYGSKIVQVAATWSVKAQVLGRKECWTLVDIPGDEPESEPDRATTAVNLAAVVHVIAEVDGHGDPLAAALDVLTHAALMDDEYLRWSVGNRIAALLDVIEDQKP